MLVLTLIALIQGGLMQQEPVLSDSRIAQVALTVSDLGRAKQFYGSTLGLPLVTATETMLFFECGGATLMLALPEGGSSVAPAGTAVYFAVENIAERAETLKERGVALEGEPHVVHRAGGRELWMAFFRDPDGHLLALMSWR